MCDIKLEYRQEQEDDIWDINVCCWGYVIKQYSVIPNSRAHIEKPIYKMSFIQTGGIEL